MATMDSSAKHELSQVSEEEANRNKLEAALRQVFDAYDLNESGHISASDFFKIEIRHGFELGDISRIWEALPRLTKADQADKGHLNFDEFCQCRLRAYTSGTRMAWVPTQQGLTQRALEEAQATIAERERMGPRYHPGIRRALKELFCELNFTDATDSSNLAASCFITPSQWIFAHTHLAKLSVGSKILKIVITWFGEDSFSKADTNQDGLLQRDEFLNLSFDVLEDACQKDNKTALTLTQEIMQKLGSRSFKEKSLNAVVTIFGQSSKEFQPPSHARRGDNIGSFLRLGKLQIPSNIVVLEDLLGLLRLHLQLPQFTWLSLFFRSANAPHGQPMHHIAYLEDVQSMLSALNDPTPRGEHFLYVKNVRPAPRDLEVQTPQPCEDRSFEERMERNFLSGRRWGIDWETQICGKGCNFPIFSTFAIGDVLAIRVPESANNKLNMSVTVFMDGISVLSTPFLENAAKIAENEKTKKGRLRNADVKAPPDGAPAKTGRKKKANQSDKASSHLLFAAQREGTCRLFVELSWAHAEEEVARQPAYFSQCQCPAAEVSVGRIGPLALEVRHGVLPPEYMRSAQSIPLMWWNGVKWTPKRGRVAASKAVSSAPVQKSPSASPRGSFGKLPGTSQSAQSAASQSPFAASQNQPERTIGQLSAPKAAMSSLPQAANALQPTRPDGSMGRGASNSKPGDARQSDSHGSGREEVDALLAAQKVMHSSVEDGPAGFTLVGSSQKGQPQEPPGKNAESPEQVKMKLPPANQAALGVPKKQLSSRRNSAKSNADSARSSLSDTERPDVRRPSSGKAVPLSARVSLNDAVVAQDGSRPSSANARKPVRPAGGPRVPQRPSTVGRSQAIP